MMGLGFAAGALAGGAGAASASLRGKALRILLIRKSFWAVKLLGCN